MPGVRGAEVARKYGVTRWQIYDWRKQFRSGRLALPESVTSKPAFAAVMVEDAPQRKAAAACIEIVVGDIVIRAEPASMTDTCPGSSALRGRYNDRAGCTSESLCRGAAGRLS